MVAADLPQIMEIERLAFPYPWTAGLFLHELKIPFSRQRVARSTGSGAVIGYACWWVVGDETHLLNLAVHPDHQRRKIGRSLVETIVRDAVGARATSVSLEVGTENQAARELYRSLDFTEAGVRRNYYARGADALILVRMLGSKEAAESA